jgi:hypothetical protein
LLNPKDHVKHGQLLALKQTHIDEIQRVRDQFKAGKVSASYLAGVEQQLASKIIKLNKRLGIR